MKPVVGKLEQENKILRKRINEIGIEFIKNEQNKTELQKIWDYCESEQLRLIEIENECGITDFIQGEILAFRKIQYKINKKCSSFQEENE